MPKYRSPESNKAADDAIEQARKVIAAPPGDAAKLLALANVLSSVNAIGYARKVLAKASLATLPIRDPLRLMVLKKLALFTYKDQDLPADERLGKAEQMLRDLLEVIPADQLELLQDSWGILGAVYKMRWTLFGSRDSLDRARAAYVSGYRLGHNADAGAYTGLNAAFVLDLLAGDSSEPAAIARRAEAEAIRREIIEVLKKAAAVPGFQPDNWFHAKLGEAYLGTGQYELACECMKNIAQRDLRNWELETMARQLSHLARLQAFKEGKSAEDLATTEAWSVVRTLLGGDATAALSFFRGKVGLALSGGGFRASLYHIGVLASLAESDMLRHVEVISCVSGGSIVGMYFYLKLKLLLESKADADIKREDYVSLVQELESEFLHGVQQNLRMRVLASPRSNRRVLFSVASSTTNRLGDLYESELYSKIGKKPVRFMNELPIRPGNQDFYPRYDNWWRAAKVPILVLNATSLNTCHNWQFTATYMGEPPQTAVDAGIDANDRLRRMYYPDAPPRYQKVRVGDAVAASACVPGLFDPLVLDDLYQDYVVRLVDGGVFDNQGVASLQEQDCSVMLVSDASGQTAVTLDPSGGHLGVSMRANNVLMARIRQCEHQLLRALSEAKVLRGMMFLHLKKDLEGAPVDWIECNDPSLKKTAEPLTSYQIRRDVQRLLAAVRTDLDSFADCEADALMQSGYRAANAGLETSITGFPLRKPITPCPWRFSSIAPIVEDPNPSDPLVKVRTLLGVADSGAFKAFKLLRFIKPLTIAGIVIGLLLLAACIGLYWEHPAGPYLFGALFVLVAAAIAVSFLDKLLVRAFHYRNGLLQWCASGLICLLGGPLLWLHFKIVDRYYIQWGPKYRPQPVSTTAPAAGSSSSGAAAGRP